MTDLHVAELPPSAALLMDDAAVREAALTYRMSVILDAVAAVAMAAGVGWGLWPWLGPFGIAVGGALLTLLVFLAGVLRDANTGSGGA